MRPSDRAVSTVLDVGLALVLISASVVMIGFYLSDSAEPADPHRAEGTAETIAGTSLSVEFDRSAVAGSENFEPPENNASELYTQTHYGSGTGLLADAAVTSSTIGDVELFGYGEDYEDSVDAAIQGSLTGSNTRFYAIARWEPYEGADLGGNATAGEYPPTTSDVSSTTISVASGMEGLDEARLASMWVGNASDRDQAYGTMARWMADRIVAGLSSPEQTQYALESQGMNRQLTVYQYQQMGEALNVSFNPDDDANSPLSWPRDGTDNDVTVPDAAAANDELAEALAEDIETDLRADGGIGEEIETILDEHVSDEEQGDELRDLFDESVAVGEVSVTIQTWTNE